MLDIARQAATQAGAVLMERFGRLAGHEIHRYGKRDVVTAADEAAESEIRRVLTTFGPDIPILGEEEAREGDSHTRRAERMWIVDPLDGTVNFVQGIPAFAVSIGLVEEGRPLLGVVHAPALGQTFWGGPGQGCFEDARPVSVSVTPMLADGIYATGFAYRRDELADDNLDNLVHMARTARGIRRMGAAALDLAYVASGRLDGFWELHLSPWDVAAGAALVRAAGGRVSDLRGGEDWLFGRHIVATNGLLHEGLRGELAPLQDL